MSTTTVTAQSIDAQIAALQAQKAKLAATPAPAPAAAAANPPPAATPAPTPLAAAEQIGGAALDAVASAEAPTVAGDLQKLSGTHPALASALDALLSGISRLFPNHFSF